MAEETAAPPIELPEELAETAKAAAWPEDLVLELLSQGAEPSDLMRYMTSGVTAEQVRQFMASQGGEQVNHRTIGYRYPCRYAM